MAKAKISESMKKELIKELMRDKKKLNAFKKRMSAFVNADLKAVDVEVTIKVPVEFFWYDGVKTGAHICKAEAVERIENSKAFKAVRKERNAAIDAFIKETEQWILETAAEKIGVRITQDEINEMWGDIF